MRNIKIIFIHCTASYQESYKDSLLINEFKRKGWRYPGYHYVIRPDGTIFNMLSEDKVSNGVAGYNSYSINIAYVGGITKKNTRGTDNRTPEQKDSLIKLLHDLRIKYPKAFIMGHRDISPDKNNNGKIDTWEYIKTCPCFNAMEEYKYLNLGLDKPRI
jgi:N-acetylmuramoyl-L-alanine amidase